MFRSPALFLNDQSSIDFWLLGGRGNIDSDPSKLSDLSIDLNANGDGGSPSDGFKGVALRSGSDNAYLLYWRKPSNGQSNSETPWQQIVWNSAAIDAAILRDSPTETYSLDSIDNSNGDWGWVALDTVTLTNVAAVPEPGAWALILLGGGPLRLAARHLKSRTPMDSPANGTSATMSTGISGPMGGGELVPRFPAPNRRLPERRPSPCSGIFLPAARSLSEFSRLGGSS